jgi:inositol 1,4,5-triphosphate receptor type 1
MIYFLVYTSFAVMGCFNEVFIALLLFDIFGRFPLLGNVLKSIWVPRNQILLTLSLFFIMQYVFAIAAYYFSYERFEGSCDTLGNCLGVIVDVQF